MAKKKAPDRRAAARVGLDKRKAARAKLHPEYSMTAIMLWMGSAGFTASEAKQAYQAKFGKPPTTDGTIAALVGLGKNKTRTFPALDASRLGGILLNLRHRLRHGKTKRPPASAK